MGRGSGTGQRSSIHSSSHSQAASGSSSHGTLVSTNQNQNQNQNSKRPLNSSDYEVLLQNEDMNLLDVGLVKAAAALHDSVVTSDPNAAIKEASVCDGVNGVAMAISSSNLTLEHDKDEAAEKAPLWHLITTYLGYLILIVTGHVRDFFLYRFYPKQFRHLSVQNGLAPINSGFGRCYR